MKRRYDVKTHKIPYKLGDAVWYYNHKRRVEFNPKLQRPWKGPMIVIDILNDLLFRIQSSLKAKPVVFHHDKLKPYLGEDRPLGLFLRNKNNKKNLVNEYPQFKSIKYNC